jgi:hypothetical protein
MVEYRYGRAWVAALRSVMINLARILLIVLLAVTAAGCSAVAGIFKAGFWAGIIIAVIVVVGLFALFARKG